MSALRIQKAFDIINAGNIVSKNRRVGSVARHVCLHHESGSWNIARFTPNVRFSAVVCSPFALATASGTNNLR